MSVAAASDIQVEDVEYLRHASGPLLARLYRPKPPRAFEGQPHTFITKGPGIAASKEAIEVIKAFVRARTDARS